MAAFDYESLIMDLPDYPKPGIVFKDITPLLADAEGFKAAVTELADNFRDKGITKVVGAEARGFVFAAPIACELGAGFIPARKPGKLPRETMSEEYALEYGTDEIHMHADAINSDDVVLIVDDLIATGGTAAAQVKMINRVGAKLAGLAFLMELEFCNPRPMLAELTDAEIVSLVKVS